MNQLGLWSAAFPKRRSAVDMTEGIRSLTNDLIGDLQGGVVMVSLWIATSEALATLLEVFLDIDYSSHSLWGVFEVSIVHMYNSRDEVLSKSSDESTPFRCSLKSRHENTRSVLNSREHTSSHKLTFSSISKFWTIPKSFLHLQHNNSITAIPHQILSSCNLIAATP